jgi:beta-glucanase (GH16 family)
MVRLLQSSLAALLLLREAYAIDPPTYAAYGWQLIWYDYFGGSQGSPPNPAVWNQITGNLGYNDELETYVKNSNNIRLSGDSTQTLQIIPTRDSSQLHGWASGRIESKSTFTPPAGKLMMVEAPIRLASSNNKQGIWPAFWMEGDSYRSKGTPWPACGEVDIFEEINGAKTGFGTAHCGSLGQGGPCNEPVGISAGTSFDNNWHTWRVIWNRRSNNWQTETITWYMDGQQFNQISGAQVGNSDVWATLAHNPLFIIINVAVGGDWVSFPSFCGTISKRHSTHICSLQAGAPNGNTQDGANSMMEVQYVSVYTG